MSKLSHSSTENMNEIDRCRAVEDGNEDLLPVRTEFKYVHLADEFDDIEVDAKGMCKWTDVANAQTHLRAQLRRIETHPLPSDPPSQEASAPQPEVES